MADGKLRIKTAFDNTGARKDAKEFEKLAYDAAKNASDNNVQIDIDISKAEKEIDNLERNIEKYQSKLAELDNGKLGEYKNKFSEIQSKADSGEISLQRSQYEVKMLKQEYSEVINEALKLKEKIDSAEISQANLVEKTELLRRKMIDSAYSGGQGVFSANKTTGFINSLERAKAKIAEIGIRFIQAGSNEDSVVRKASGLINTLSAAGRIVRILNNEYKTSNMLIQSISYLTSKGIQNKIAGIVNLMRTGFVGGLRLSLQIAGRLAQKIGSALLNGLRRSATAARQIAKSLGKSLINNLKKAASRLLSIGKNASKLNGSFMKMGLAFVGIRSLMNGFRSIISQALNDNEKLQNQLTAIKGIMGQALAPAINILVQGLSQMVMFADKLYQAFTGISLVAKYNASQSKKAADSAKEQSKQLASFDEVNKLGDDNSSNQNSNETEALFQTVDLSNWLNNIANQIKNGDWAGAGKAIADGINDALAKINWSGIQNKVNSFCKNLGDAVNGFVSGLDWDNVGNTVGQGLNTVTGAINSLVDRVDWDNLGAGFGKGLNGLVNRVDGNALGKTLSAKLKILTDTLYGFFGEFDFNRLGNKIGDTVMGWLNNINWGKVASNISSAIKGLFDTISGMIDNINWNDGDDSVTAKIKEFCKNIDWAGICTSAFEALGKVLGGLGSVVVQLLKDAWGNWKSQYIDPAVEEAGGNVVAGVFNGIAKWLSDVGKWIKENIWDPFVEGFKSTFDIHSPSKDPKIVELGSFLIEGVFNGIIDWLKGIKTWFKENVFSKITSAWNDMEELTFSIGGKIQESFTKTKEKWDSIQEKGKEALATIKGKIADTFSNLKTKWDSVKDKVSTTFSKGSIQGTFMDLKSKWDSIKDKINTTFSKGAVQSSFTNLKSKWDSIKNKTNTNTIKGAVQNAFTSAKSKWDAIKNKTVTVTATAKDKASSVFKNIANSFIDFINKAIDKINSKLKISISRTLSKVLNAIGVKVTNGSYQLFSIPKIPKLAKGGIAYNPGKGVTATVGEGQYPEAILPLSDTVLGKLASMIGSQMSGASGQITIPIYLDGRVIAKYVIDLQNKRAFALNKGGAY